MRSLRLALLLYLTCVVVGTRAAAQDTVVVQPGARVRVRVDSSARWYTGRFIGRDADSLRLQDDLYRAYHAVLLREITETQASAGRSPRTSIILATAATGLVAGVLWGRAHAAREERRCKRGSCGLAAAFEPPVMGMAGAFVGAVVGFTFQFEAWRPALLLP